MTRLNAAVLLAVLLANAGVLHVVEAQSSIKSSSGKRWTFGKKTNWTALLSEPSAFVYRAVLRLKKRQEGFHPSSTCGKYTGMLYLDSIRSSRVSLCSPGSSAASGEQQHHRSRALRSTAAMEAALPPSQSSLDCYTAPAVTQGNSSKATISLCRSRNLVLDTCGFLAERQRGQMSKKFPRPLRGAVRLGGCGLANASRLAGRDPARLGWLRSMQQSVWWENATRDDAAVAAACAPGSPTLVTTPTLFVLRDRHANYAHEMEVVSMAFSFLAALEPRDVAERGVQVVIADQAPPTGFLETWARMSQPHRLRLLAQDPFPPGTCFASAYHVYTFAAGIGYNTNPATVKCESPVLQGMSHWLRQLYDEADASARSAPSQASAAAAVAGPATAAAGITGLRVPAGGIVVKNVVWLSRRNLEMVRLLLNASVGWKSMRMVRNEDAVVAGLVAAVQEWNAESCLLRRFDRNVAAEVERSKDYLRPVHGGTAATTTTATTNAGAATAGTGARTRGLLSGAWAALASAGRRLLGAAAFGSHSRPASEQQSAVRSSGRRIQQADPDFAGDEEEDGEEEGADVGAGQAGAGGEGAAAEGEFGGGDGTGAAAEGAAATAATANRTRAPYMVGGNIIMLSKLWELDKQEEEQQRSATAASGGAAANGPCRPTNVLFKFVDGDFNDAPYSQQLATIFRTGVLAGVHGAGLTHGFYMQPGQGAVLQLLGDSFAQVAANNVFRNMARGLGHHYEDVLYSGVDVDVPQLKAAVKRSMDYVAQQVMEAQERRSGPLRLVLVDQTHFSVVMPPAETCPALSLQGAAAAAGAAAGEGQEGGEHSARALPLDVVLRICGHLADNEVAVTARLLCKEARAAFASATLVRAGGLRDCDPRDGTNPAEVARAGSIGGVPLHAVRWLIRYADPSARHWLTLRQRFWLLERTRPDAATPLGRQADVAAAGNSGKAAHPATEAAAVTTGSGASGQRAASDCDNTTAQAVPGAWRTPHQLWRRPPDGLAASDSEWAQPPLLPPPLSTPRPPSGAAARPAPAGGPTASGSSSSGTGSTDGCGCYCPVSGYADTPPRLLLQSMDYVLVEATSTCRDALLAAAQWGDSDAITLLARDAMFRMTMSGPRQHQNRSVVLSDLTWAFCGGRVAPELLSWMFGASPQSLAEVEAGAGAPFAEWRHSDVPYLAAAVYLHNRQAADDGAGSAASGRRSKQQRQQRADERRRGTTDTYALLDQIRAVGGFAFDGTCGGTFLRAVWLAAAGLGGHGLELLSWLLDRGCPTGPPGWAYAAAVYPHPIACLRRGKRTYALAATAESDPQQLPQAPVLEWLRARGVPMGPDAARCVDRFWMLADRYSRYLQWLAEQGCSIGGEVLQSGGEGRNGSSRNSGGGVRDRWRSAVRAASKSHAGGSAGGAGAIEVGATEAQAGPIRQPKSAKRRPGPARKALRRLLRSCVCGGSAAAAAAADRSAVQSRGPGARALGQDASGHSVEDSGAGDELPAESEGGSQQDGRAAALARILCSVPDGCWAAEGPRGTLNRVPGGPLDRALAHMLSTRARRPPRVEGVGSEAPQGAASDEGSREERGRPRAQRARCGAVLSGA
ncbi:hypothetical protein HXX76_001790 [Chlamydomonas incerta]|uniref:F-box domain-containing protein n=1 Tax=Chlamydomonas incerta TaxID=51695 RepID=A0A835TGP7_CHLIN|nr:hypothetical protein HXX76_001790 [Chlamydomonas incerta]|eukprot:KAG2443432.1 hypothetical protein HXX76_001790 [Chlamydomonas incerta]